MPDPAAPPSPDVISLGCRLNAYEGEAMRRLAAEAGLADAVIINSCAVTNEAVRQTRQTIRRLRRDRADARIIVTGCAAQIEPQKFADMPEVDAVLGNQEKLAAAEWRALAAGEAPLRVNDFFSARDTAGPLLDGYGDRARAFLQIQNGCDHRCTFCVIPLGRGPSRSTSLVRVVEEAGRLVAGGHEELVLTGVDITSWGADLAGAPRLGALVSAVLDGTPGLRRLRLSSIDGAELDDELFARLTEDPRLAPHAHLSLQAGDDLILKRMKRRHSRAAAVALCAALRAKRPEIAIGADLIAGFPTEDDAMFANTLRLIDDADLQYVHVFPFSPREGAPATLMPQTPRDVVKARAAQLREKAEAALTRFLDSLVGGTFEAVRESGGRARLGNFAAVRLAQDDAGPVGKLMTVRVTARDGAGLVGLADGNRK